MHLGFLPACSRSEPRGARGQARRLRGRHRRLRQSSRAAAAQEGTSEGSISNANGSFSSIARSPAIRLRSISRVTALRSTGRTSCCRATCVLDACRDNLFVDGTGRGIGGTRGLARVETRVARSAQSLASDRKERAARWSSRRTESISPPAITMIWCCFGMPRPAISCEASKHTPMMSRLRRLFAERPEGQEARFRKLRGDNPDLGRQHRKAAAKSRSSR
jgi:hypothetical protein